jgi:hypothetical protein
MRVSITLETDNDAFAGSELYEVSGILETVTRKIKIGEIDVEPGARYPLRDSNGNRVGFFTVKD